MIREESAIIQITSLENKFKGSSLTMDVFGKIHLGLCGLSNVLSLSGHCLSLSKSPNPHVHCSLMSECMQRL